MVCVWVPNPHKEVDQDDYCGTTSSKPISPRLMRFEKKLLINAEIAPLFDVLGTASADAYNLVRGLCHASIIRGRVRSPDARKAAKPILPFPFFWLVCAHAFEHALLCGCRRPTSEQKATEAELRPHP